MWGFRLFFRRARWGRLLGRLERGECGAGERDGRGNSLLHCAVMADRADLVERLLASGLSPYAKNKAGITPLFLAGYLHRPTLLSILAPASDLSRKPLPVTICGNRTRRKGMIAEGEFEERLSIRYIDRLEFEHSDYLEWSLWRAQTLLRRERIRKMNKWILSLYGEEMEKPRRDHVYIRHINGRIGYGIFANRDLPALTYVGEYTGVVAKRKAKRIRCNDYVFGYMVGPKDTPYIIDAREKSNFTRFINHSYFPNMNSRWVIAEGVGKIILFTNRFIPEGTQLTYDYGKYYWRSRPSPDEIM
ncbi:MAG: SET domain-containing protein-lysine N-methyltransferase [Simkaniaceae bacterium]|nr:SET domain-containing protein-lysine N-methyltransferase [Simkaniaceae bacterium]